MSQSVNKLSSIKQKVANSAELKKDGQHVQKLPFISSQLRNSLFANYNNLFRDNVILRCQGMNPTMFLNQSQLDSFYFPYNSLADELSYNFIVFPCNFLPYKQQFVNKTNKNNFKALNSPPISKFIDQNEKNKASNNEEIRFNSINKGSSLNQFQNLENIKRDQIILNQQNQVCQNKNIKQKLQNKQKKTQKKLKKENEDDEDEETVSDFEEEQVIKRFKRKENSSVTQNENLQDSTSSLRNTTQSNIITRQKSQLIQSNTENNQISNKIDNQKQKIQQVDEASPEGSTILQQKQIKKNKNEFQDLQQKNLIKINQQLNQDLNGDQLIPKIEKLSINTNSFQQQQQLNYEKQLPSQSSSNLVKVQFQKKEFANQAKNAGELFQNNYLIRNNIQEFSQNSFGNQEQFGQKSFEGQHQYYQQPTQNTLQLKQQNVISQYQTNKQDKHQNQQFQYNLFTKPQKDNQINSNIQQQFTGKNNLIESNQIIFQNKNTYQNDQLSLKSQNNINRDIFTNKRENNCNQNSINIQQNFVDESNQQGHQNQKRQPKRKQRKMTEKLENKQKQASIQNNFQVLSDQTNIVETFQSSNQQSQYQYPSTPLPQLTSDMNQSSDTTTNYQRLCFSEDLSSNKTNYNYFQTNFNQQSSYREEQFMNIQDQYQFNNEQQQQQQQQQQQLQQQQQQQQYYQNQMLLQNNNTQIGYSYQNYDLNYETWPFYLQEQDRNKYNYSQSHIKTLFAQNDETQFDNNTAFNNEHMNTNQQYNIVPTIEENDDEKIFAIIGEIKDNQEY
ncbi:hypothetical protein TTHERM_00237470 (macronuclear) [Tetrahymena thermophila SB210]|uniref:Uncharacterized protein n=1 Tax=Tetrahymena thermophila (strain SB210) TaxID=312017 RepID=I7MMB5_TETTS|nr:hypothetical protein TTHERM_00237470 [Tetrahymena thermophila SB210]EAS04532.3 hypothetical protein TTHERM_00237470 [Tetrahymena thermophila SB210]|eukprot:XP_001024777.3 hypothetical protein TTHERM_00237470 [Tetrahymena thermophila SB210]